MIKNPLFSLACFLLDTILKAKGHDFKIHRHKIKAHFCAPDTKHTFLSILVFSHQIQIKIGQESLILSGILRVYTQHIPYFIIPVDKRILMHK